MFLILEQSRSIEVCLSCQTAATKGDLLRDKKTKSLTKAQSDQTNSGCLDDGAYDFLCLLLVELDANLDRWLVENLGISDSADHASAPRRGQDLLLNKTDRMMQSSKYWNRLM